MRGEGASVGRYQSRPCYGMKTLKRCKTNGEADNVVVIDVDNESLNNIIIIDVPENLTKKLKSSSGLRKDKICPLRTYIYIDDDESPEIHHPGTGIVGDGEFNSGASSSMGFGHMVDAVGDEYHFAQENKSPLKLSKCKRTYSGKASNNRVSFTTDSDSDSSDNDGPDCEFMEDSSGLLREQWEKAYLKRKSDVHNPQSCNASTFSTDAHQDIDEDNKTEKYPGASVCSNPRKSSYEKEDQPPSVATGDGNLRSTSCDPKKSRFANTDLNLTQKTHIHHSNANIQAQGESLAEDPSSCNAEQQTQRHFEHGGFDHCNNEGRNQQGSPLSPNNQQGNKQVSSQLEDRIPRAEPCSSDSVPSGNVNACVPVDEASWCHVQCSVENEVDHAQLVSRDKDEKCEHAPYTSNSHFTSDSELKNCIFKQSEKSDSREPLRRNAQLSGEPLATHGVSPSHEKIGVVPEETFSCKRPSSKQGISNNKNFIHEKGEPVPEEPSFCNIHLDEAQFKRETSCLVEGDEACVESVSNCEEDNERNGFLHASYGDAKPIEVCIISEREKLKETDEYKQAMEEEQLSRQRALKIQAEEAQQLRRLRKRRKAESLRLLDMEKKQKQRVEEIRETQKKDVEKMNLKELHRTQVCKELKRLELTCLDMASLLRGLGIQVGAGLHPLPHEVRAAFKRALLSFHPDRASGSDMRQQVEAEEKFKLISRMKEKFLPTS